MAKYRILSIDGGGIRGLLAARVLQRLEKSAPGWIGQATLLAGTSTGAIIAMGLANGMAPNEIGDIYKTKGSKIFDDSFFDNVVDLGKLIGADYSNKGLKSVLNATFGELALKDLSKKVVIPTFDLDNEGFDDKGKSVVRTWKPKIFHNFSGSDSDGKRLVKDIALYTTSAPTYFPSADGYIDGGVFANNPSVVAIAQALSTRNIAAELADIDDIVLLSIGTGVTPKHIKGPSLDWGKAQWAMPLINLLLEGVSSVADFQSAQILGDRYKRVQVTFDPGEIIETDSVDKIDRLEEIAKGLNLTEAEKWLKQYWI